MPLIYTCQEGNNIGEGDSTSTPPYGNLSGNLAILTNSSHEDPRVTDAGQLHCYQLCY